MIEIKSVRAALVALVVAVSGSCSAQVLYKVTGKGLESPSYLFGTHHLAPPDVVERFGALSPFDSCSQVVGEINMVDGGMEMARELQAHMTAPADSTLSKLISREDFEYISREFRKWSPVPGVELSMFDGLKPMGITSMVSVGISKESMPGFQPEEQLDAWFQARAVATGKKVIALETVAEQAALLFDSTPLPVQAKNLVSLLKDTSKAVVAATALSEAYMAQDLGKMEELSDSEKEDKAFMDALLYKRNAAWLGKLPGIFKEGPTFVAVGALHLAGESGLVNGLRKLGYTVEASGNF